MSFRWIISQIGARQHYGIPRGFHYKGDLRLLYTEAWCRWGHSLLSRGNSPMRAFAGRRHPDLPNSKVISFNVRTITQELANRRTTFTLEQQHLEYLRVGKWFAQAVAKDLHHQQLDPAQDIFFGFNTGCLETFEFLKDRGIPTICDQIDPARIEEQMVHEESLKWPGWEKYTGRIPESYWQRMDAEWAAASMILVNSNWSKQALIKQGVPADKMFIAPVAYQADLSHAPARANNDGPLTVLWLGSVNLRKGIQYLIQAAQHLVGNRRIRIIVAGQVLISHQVVAEAPKNMEFVGRVTRDQTQEMYRKADLFVLPTISDGFAITQIEAMAQGLPVITTPNCGDVVTDGIDGLIIPAFDSQALAQAISKLDEDRPLLREMSHRAIEKSKHFQLSLQTQLMEDAVTQYRQKI